MAFSRAELYKPFWRKWWDLSKISSFRRATSR